VNLQSGGVLDLHVVGLVR